MRGFRFDVLASRRCVPEYEGAFLRRTDDGVCLRTDEDTELHIQDVLRVSPPVGRLKPNQRCTVWGMEAAPVVREDQEDALNTSLLEAPSVDLVADPEALEPLSAERFDYTVFEVAPLRDAKVPTTAKQPVSAEALLENILTNHGLDLAVSAALHLSTGYLPHQMRPLRMKDVLWDGYPHASGLRVLVLPSRRLFRVAGTALRIIETMWGLLGGLHAHPSGVLLQAGRAPYVNLLDRLGYAVPTPDPSEGAAVPEGALLRKPLEGLDPDEVDHKALHGVMYIFESGHWRPLYYTPDYWAPGHPEESPWSWGKYAADVLARQPLHLQRYIQRHQEHLSWNSQ